MLQRTLSIRLGSPIVNLVLNESPKTFGQEES